MVREINSYKKLVRSMRIMSETISKLTIRFNLDLRQRSEIEELIKDLAKARTWDITKAAEEVRKQMENKHKNITEIRAIYNIPIVHLKEFQPDDAS